MCIEIQGTYLVIIIIVNLILTIKVGKINHMAIPNILKLFLK